MNTDTLTACPLCRSIRLRPLPVPGHWIGPEVFRGLALGLCRCRSCNFTFTNPRPDAQVLNRFYSGNTYVCHTEEGAGPTRGSHVLDFIGGPPKRLLDFGCGAGDLLAAAKASGWIASGYEPGTRGLETCVRRGLPVTNDLASIPDASADVITLVHVFEHLPDRSSTLSELRRMLSPGGCVYIEVPNIGSLRAKLAGMSSRFDERYRAFPIHLGYFSASHLSLLLHMHGWSIVRFTTLGFGVDQLVRRVRANPPQSIGRPAVEPLRGPRGLRRLVKSAFMSLGWGENLAVISRPAF
jgi:SAM-dependent methyltransferase